MENVFNYCALIGSLIFVGQLALSLLGFGLDELDLPDADVDLDVPDADLDVDTSFEESGVHDGWLVGIISFRSLVAAMAVFGLTGRAVVHQLSPINTILVASLAGCGMLYLVGWTFKQLFKIRSDGTVRIHQTIGCPGQVYLKVPANRTAVGKVTINVNGRTMEYQAVTTGEELPVGAQVIVNEVTGPDTLEVSLAAQTADV